MLLQKNIHTLHDWSLSQISFIITFFCSKFIQNLHWIIRRFILTWSFNFCLKANEKEVTNKMSVPGSWICNLLIYEWDKRNNSVLLYYHHTINHSKQGIKQGNYYKHVQSNLYRHAGNYSYGMCRGNKTNKQMTNLERCFALSLKQDLLPSLSKMNGRKISCLIIYSTTAMDTHTKKWWTCTALTLIQRKATIFWMIEIQCIDCLH